MQHQSSETKDTNRESSVTNDWSNPLLTDMYQIKMTYAEWKGNRHEEPAIFEMFFRKNPFNGKYAVFGGHDEVYTFIENYKFTEEHISYLKEMIPQAEDEFFEYLRKLDCSKVTIEGAGDGDLVFPEEPLLRIHGPLALL